MAAVPTVHEQMNDRAEQQEDIRERPEQVCSVFLPEEETRNGQEEAEPEPHRKARGLTVRVRFNSGRHGFLHLRLRAHQKLAASLLLACERI
jgi:hypothetical protein